MAVEALGRMYHPPHPGEIILANYLEPCGISARTVAKNLGVADSTFNRILQGKSAISPDMAIRLSRVLGGTIESWLDKQQMYDIWCALQNDDHSDLERMEFHVLEAWQQEQDVSLKPEALEV